MERLKVALIGYGYWGPNLARNLEAHPRVHLRAIVDSVATRTDAARDAYPQIMVGLDLKRVADLLLPDLDAVVIATPPETHNRLAREAMELGLDVLLEKPAALTIEEAQQLVNVAEEQHCQLMVDHVYCYSAAARTIKGIIDAGELGDLLYVNSTRVNLGLFQHRCNVVWDLAVHDFSLLEYFFPDLLPTRVTATGTRHYTHQHDTAHIGLQYADSRAQAHVHVSWLSPLKIRQMLIVGSRKSIVWDDTNPVEPVKVYDSSAKVVSESPDAIDWRMEYRRGDIYVPRVNNSETLHNVVDEFVSAIEEKRQPLTDGRAGVRVVRLLKQASSCLRSTGEKYLSS